MFFRLIRRGGSHITGHSQPAERSDGDVIGVTWIKASFCGEANCLTPFGLASFSWSISNVRTRVHQRLHGTDPGQVGAASNSATQSLASRSNQAIGPAAA